MHVKTPAELARGQTGLVGDMHLGLLGRSWCESNTAGAVGVGGSIVEALPPAARFSAWWGLQVSPCPAGGEVILVPVLYMD